MSKIVLFRDSACCNSAHKPLLLFLWHCFAWNKTHVSIENSICRVSYPFRLIRKIRRYNYHSGDSSGPNAFRFAYVDALTGVGTFVRLRREAVDKYLVTYTAGFSLRGYSYFLTSQRESFAMTDGSGAPYIVSPNTISKIVQVAWEIKLLVFRQLNNKYIIMGLVSVSASEDVIGVLGS